MGNQAIATLEWYLAMGIDELVEETPQNRLIEPTKEEPKETPKAEKPTNIPEFKPQHQSLTTKANNNQDDVLKKSTELAAQAKTIDELHKAIIDFKELNICNAATQAVFSDGALNSPLMVIGEAPGANEDKQGIPFCGTQGQLLDKMLAAIGMSRTENVYLTNSVFWRPAGGRAPTNEEISICRPFVQKHIELAKPKAILALGSIAANSILNKQDSVSRIRGTSQAINNIEVIASYSPSQLLKQPLQKRLAWQDLLSVKACLEK